MGWKIDKAKAQDVFEKVAQENSYNPIKEYLEYLEKDLFQLLTRILTLKIA